MDSESNRVDFFPLIFYHLPNGFWFSCWTNSHRFCNIQHGFCNFRIPKEHWHSDLCSAYVYIAYPVNRNGKFIHVVNMQLCKGIMCKHLAISNLFLLPFKTVARSKLHQRARSATKYSVLKFPSSFHLPQSNDGHEISNFFLHFLLFFLAFDCEYYRVCELFSFFFTHFHYRNHLTDWTVWLRTVGKWRRIQNV